MKIFGYELKLEKVNKEPEVEVVDKDGQVVNKPSKGEKFMNAVCTGLKIAAVGGLAAGAAILNGNRVGKEKDKVIRDLRETNDQLFKDNCDMAMKLENQEEETVDESEADEAEDVEE